MTPDTNLANITIRLARADEAPAMAVFLQLHGEPAMQRTWLYLQHHFQTTFLAEDENGHLQGMLISWKSPEKYNTAVVDGFAVNPQFAGTALTCLMLEAAMLFWANQCVLTLLAPALEHIPEFDEVLKNAGFEPLKINGLAQLKKSLTPTRICLNMKRMRPRMNTSNGEVNEETLFEYFQDGDLIWGTYSGGPIARGVLVGKMNANRDIRFHYLQLDYNGQFSEGTSKSATEFLNDGRVVLYEDWEWTGNKKGSGNSIIEEVKE